MATIESDLASCDYLEYRRGDNEIIVGGNIDRVNFAKEVAEKEGDNSIVEPLGTAALVSEIELSADPDN